MPQFLREVSGLFLLAIILALQGCGSSETTVQPATPEPVPADAPVNEPPSTDEG